MSSSIPKTSSMLIAALACVACGGGGDEASSAGPPAPSPSASSPPPPSGVTTNCAAPSPGPAGVFGAKVAPGSNDTLVLVTRPDGTYVGFLGQETGSSFDAPMVFRTGHTCQTTGQPPHNTYGSNIGDALVTASVIDPLVPSISGAIQSSAGTLTFTGGPIVGSSYDFHAPASIADITGEWRGPANGNGQRDGLTIQADGSLTGSAAGCTVAGQATPTADGKNLFLLAMTCPSTGWFADEGMLLVYRTVDGGSRLFAYALFTNGWDWHDWYLVASRP